VDNPVAMLSAGLLGGFNLRLTQYKDIEIYAQGVANISLGVFIPYFEDMMKFRGELIAPTIRVPTFIISGDRDNVTPEKFQKDLHESIKNSIFLRIPYGSHCCQLDFPEFINLKIDDFIRDVKGP
jgi:pimeloyl-ACP methyl ester carboxylesterase